MTSGLSHSDISNTVSPTINAASCSDTRTERDENTEVAAESKEKKAEEREIAHDGSAAPAMSSEDGLECNVPVPAPPELLKEGRKVRQPRDPGMPSREEWQEHMRTHFPYRSWCKFCAAGRGRARKRRRNAAKSIIRSWPHVSLDYGFL